MPGWGTKRSCVPHGAAKKKKERKEKKNTSLCGRVVVFYIGWLGNNLLRRGHLNREGGKGANHENNWKKRPWMSVWLGVFQACTARRAVWLEGSEQRGEE